MENGIIGARSTHGRGAQKVLVGKPEGETTWKT